MTTCNCINCLVKERTKCSPGFPKMIWLSEYVYFSMAIFTRNEEEYSLIIDNICFLMNNRSKLIDNRK